MNRSELKCLIDTIFLGHPVDLCACHRINVLVAHYLFDTSRVYTIVKITLKQNYIQLYVS